MELLLELYLKVQQVNPLPVFTQESIIVQNAGMQHWLNMSLAQLRGVSLNYHYALPSQFLWKLAKNVAGEQAEADQQSYSREVLAWRIFHLFGDKHILNDNDFESVIGYWQTEPNTQKAQLKCYQFAVQLADLFEQYLVFRPDWLDHWQQGNFELNPLDQHTSANSQNNAIQQMHRWQGKLWFQLQQQIPYNPRTLIQQAGKNLTNNKAALPTRVSFFGINAMAPMWLSFIEKLSEHTQVHFFHLNPCADYWGDIQTEKQAFKHIEQWLALDDELSQNMGNPLLANLGQQGREFLSLLQQVSTYAIDAFEAIEEQHKTPSSNPILQRIQQDILHLSDQRTAGEHHTSGNIEKVIDDSITITSAHSPLREVQGLHDWLLAQLNEDDTLTPKDILVMCPQVEKYAPFIDAVFTRGWQELDSKIPPLPCSIADRVTKNSDPIVAAFLELLSVPDSRFEVNQLLAFLRVNAVQEKFNFSQSDLDKITLWLQQATIHWGLNNEHKALVLGVDEHDGTFTWEQGLQRLMRGFAFADEDDIFQNQRLVACVEGDDVLLLGQLMWVLEQLQWHAKQLLKARTPSQWQHYLTQLFDSCFSHTEEDSQRLIYQAINQLVEYCQAAHFEQKIDFLLIKDFLSQHFSEPDPGRQFMVGQVTFCSMLPMRSIPFKVIAILGLNDGEYPRQRTPTTFDLMQQTKARIGDRSRRGDDRYLFLEALISARKALYLSYQGHNIKNNAPLQPSLVLKELFDYLTNAYGWCFDVEKNNDIRQLPMQAFSEKNYQGTLPSFNGKWLDLIHRQATTDVLKIEPPSGKDEQASVVNTKNITITELIRFFQHPAKYFAEQQLNLSLVEHTVLLDDVEPFQPDQLISYLYKQDLLAAKLDQTSSSEQQQLQCEKLTQHYELSGKLPNLPSTEHVLKEWQNNADEFAHFILQQGLTAVQTYQGTLTFVLPDQQRIALTFELPLSQPAEAGTEPCVVFYRSSRAKAKDFLQLTLAQLCLQITKQPSDNVQVSSADNQTCLARVVQTQGCYFDTKAQQVTAYNVQPFENPEAVVLNLLTTFMAGNQQALLLNADIGQKHCTKPLTQQGFEKLWQDPNAIALVDDPYMHYFWPQVPIFETHVEQFEAVYQPLFRAVAKVKI